MRKRTWTIYLPARPKPIVVRSEKASDALISALKENSGAFDVAAERTPTLLLRVVNDALIAPGNASPQEIISYCKRRRGAFVHAVTGDNESLCRYVKRGTPRLPASELDFQAHPCKRCLAAIAASP